MYVGGLHSGTNTPMSGATSPALSSANATPASSTATKEQKISPINLGASPMVDIPKNRSTLQEELEAEKAALSLLDYAADELFPSLDAENLGLGGAKVVSAGADSTTTAKTGANKNAPTAPTPAALSTGSSLLASHLTASQDYGGHSTVATEALKNISMLAGQTKSTTTASLSTKSSAVPSSASDFLSVFQQFAQSNSAASVRTTSPVSSSINVHSLMKGVVPTVAESKPKQEQTKGLVAGGAVRKEGTTVSARSLSSQPAVTARKHTIDVGSLISNISTSILQKSTKSASVTSSVAKTQSQTVKSGSGANSRVSQGHHSLTQGSVSSSSDIRKTSSGNGQMNTQSVQRVLPTSSAMLGQQQRRDSGISGTTSTSGRTAQRTVAVTTQARPSASQVSSSQRSVSAGIPAKSSLVAGSSSSSARSVGSVSSAHSVSSTSKPVVASNLAASIHHNVRQGTDSTSLASVYGKVSTSPQQQHPRASAVATVHNRVQSHTISKSPVPFSHPQGQRTSVAMSSSVASGSKQAAKQTTAGSTVGHSLHVGSQPQSSVNVQKNRQSATAPYQSSPKPIQIGHSLSPKPPPATQSHTTSQPVKRPHSLSPQSQKAGIYVGMTMPQLHTQTLATQQKSPQHHPIPRGSELSPQAALWRGSDRVTAASPDYLHSHIHSQAQVVFQQPPAGYQSLGLGDISKHSQQDPGQLRRATPPSPGASIASLTTEQRLELMAAGKCSH